jgi:NADH:ubiquinone reductase (H+-translocating)
MTQKFEVVVVGGGYAGVMAANRLTRRDDVTVTLINPRPSFVERIRLHQLVTGSDDAVVDFGQVLAGRVRLVVDAVDRIDATARRLTLTSGASVGYDYLVYAVGSGSAAALPPGAAEHAYPIATLEEAQRLAPALDAAAAVTVVGAGPSGIETAAELAERGRRVTLVCGDVLGPYLHPRGRRAVARRLAALGVTVRQGADATVTAVTPDAVQLSGGASLPSDVTIWTAGFGVPDLATRSGLTTDSVGRLVTDETLTSVDDPRIVAAGDSAAPSGLPFRMSCQAAGQLGMQAANTVLSRIEGAQPVPIRVAFAGQCLSLGRRAGLFQFARRSDVAIGAHLGGRAAARLKEFVCRQTVDQLAYEARKPGARNWAVSDPRRQELLRAGSGEGRVGTATR